MTKFYIEDIVHAVLMAKKSISIQFCPNSTIYSKFPYGFTLVDTSSPTLEQMALKVANGDKTSGIISGLGFDNSKADEIHSISFCSDDVDFFEFS